MNIVEWICTVFDLPTSAQNIDLLYPIGAVVLLILLDGVISFIIGSITSLTSRGRY